MKVEGQCQSVQKKSLKYTLVKFAAIIILFMHTTQSVLEKWVPIKTSGEILAMRAVVS